MHLIFRILIGPCSPLTAFATDAVATVRTATAAVMTANFRLVVHSCNMCSVCPIAAAPIVPAGPRGLYGLTASGWYDDVYPGA